MWRLSKALVLAFVINPVLFIYSAQAAPESPAAQAETKLQQVALFKNGLGFFVSEVTCPKKEDSFSFVPAAAASHGTFWVSYPPKVNLESLTAKKIELEESIEAISTEELLKANVGKEVQLTLDDKGETIIHGVLSSVAENRSEPQPNPYAPGSADYSNVPRYIQPTERARLIIVKTDEGDVAIDSQNVRRVKCTDGKVNKTFINKSKSMQLDVKLEAPAGGKKLTVSYLAKGITWAPSYIVDITEPNKAQMSAKAEIINEACDLNGVMVQLVTGFPNLQFSDIVSPLAMKENLAQFLQSLARGRSERGPVSVMSNAMVQQSLDYMSTGEPAGLMPAYGAAEAGKVAEDLFMYPVKNVQLKKGQVGYFPLFTESVSYKHIYQWKIPDYVTDEEQYSYRQRTEQGREPQEEVWHCLKMENATKVPWTTAPAEIIKEGLILGQDTLNYTPVKGESTLKITLAASVKAEQVELETDRKRDAAQLYGNHFDLITVEGKLSVTNFQEKAITLEITKTLSGEVKSSEPQATIETLARGLSRMNAVRKLTWTTELEPGRQKKLSYIYEVYVRR